MLRKNSSGVGDSIACTNKIQITTGRGGIQKKSGGEINRSKEDTWIALWRITEEKE